MRLYAIAAAFVLAAIAVVSDASAQVDPCRSTVTFTAGTVTVCPKGDGDPLTNSIEGGNSQITLTVRLGGTPIPGIPAEDMWLVGCSDGLLLCGGSSGSNADAPTNAQGQTTFSNEPAAGGCDTGLYVVVQGTVIQ